MKLQRTLLVIASLTAALTVSAPAWADLQLPLLKTAWPVTQQTKS